MKQMLFFVCMLIGLLPLSSIAQDKNVTCEPPQGTRIDYFTKNPANYQNESFTMGRDRVSGMQPRIFFEEENVLFTISDSALAEEAKAETEKMTVLQRSEDQITFAGMLKDAPLLASYYPKMKILIYSQQSQWPGPDFVGARAFIFYSKCSEEVINNAPASDTTTTSPS